MKQLIKRAHKRRAIKTPITHSIYNKENHSELFPIACHDGIMVNISDGGMYFESDIPCWEKGPVYVNLTGESRALLLSDKTEALSGSVVWCSENTKKGPQFRIGIRFDEHQEINYNLTA